MSSIDRLHAPAKHRPPIDSAGPTIDPESQAWIDGLSTAGPDRRSAVDALHGLLLEAARFEIRRRRATASDWRDDDDDATSLVHRAADDALVAVLNTLGDFRGESRFTTWACKFALADAAVKVRRRDWKGREIQLGSAGWTLIADGQSPPPRELESAGLLLNALQEGIERDLSPHQREVLVATALDEVPIDVLAERLETTRGALYETIHEARRKLRATLADRGLGGVET